MVSSGLRPLWCGIRSRVPCATRCVRLGLLSAEGAPQGETAAPRRLGGRLIPVSGLAQTSSSSRQWTPEPLRWLNRAGQRTLAPSLGKPRALREAAPAASARGQARPHFCGQTCFTFVGRRKRLVGSLRHVNIQRNTTSPHLRVRRWRTVGDAKPEAPQGDPGRAPGSGDLFGGPPTRDGHSRMDDTKLRRRASGPTSRRCRWSAHMVGAHGSFGSWWAPGQGDVALHMDELHRLAGGIRGCVGNTRVAPSSDEGRGKRTDEGSCRSQKPKGVSGSLQRQRWREQRTR
jgi:hypothetical protein